MTTLIRDILLRDPARESLINNGQARITDELTNDRILKELRGELSTFICEGQYAEGTIKILSSYLANRSHTSQAAAWVSGFYGSGKSHLLKMLSHLWADTEFPDGVRARSLVHELPEEVHHLLRELDVEGKRSGGLLAAAGTLPAGSTENVRLSVLAILLRACRLPTHYPQAQFHLWLEERGFLETVKGAVEAAGKKWPQELNNLYVSPVIAKAMLNADVNFATSEAAARELLKAQFPLPNGDLTTEEFIAIFQRVLSRQGRDGNLPCTILVLDEAQAYIDDFGTRSVIFTEIAEALCKQLDGQVMLVAAGQSALSAVKLLNKMLHRFTIRIQLSDTDVETVTRKVLLRKRPAALESISTMLAAHAGEVSRQLQGTALAERQEDKAVIIEDYPLLPVRRRFWEQCFRQIDVPGTQSQLRSQLRIIHDCLAKLSGEELGRLIPGDDLYEALAPEMVNSGALPREINDRILALGKSGFPKDRFRQRVCGLVFLIGKLPREAGADTKVRATKEHIADLLVDNLAADNGKLRAEVAAVLDQLVADGVLMRIAEEYRIQTVEGRNWEEEFRRREAKLKNDVALFDERRDQLFGAEVNQVISRAKLPPQGAAKVKRDIVMSRSQDPPASDGASIPVWLRDGFSASEKEILEAARRWGVTSPTLFLFIPRRSREDLLSAIATELAAEQTLTAKGDPSIEEGREARQSMLSRYEAAKKDRETLVRDIVSGAKLFQGGGNELLNLSLEEKLQKGAEAALARLFPRFKEADFASSAWESALKRARDGADQPFSPIGYQGAIEQHPVCKQVLTTIGSAKIGAEIRAELERSPFGWPRDGVDAALIALHRSQHITATLNGVVVVAGQLDQNRISKAEFRVEKITLTVPDRNALRALYQEVEVKAKGEELDAKTPEFFAALRKLAADAGGDAPLPLRPSLADIDDVEKRVGNDRLTALREKADDLNLRIATWKKASVSISKRLPSWQMLERLADHSKAISEAKTLLGQYEAIRAQRLLINEPDPVAPVLKGLADLLRQVLNLAQSAHESAYEKGMSSLSSDSTWDRLSAADQISILSEVALDAPEKPNLGSDQALLAVLDIKNLVARRTESEAVSVRVEKARELAAKLLEPKIQFVPLDRGVVKTEAEVDAWIANQRKKLLAALKDGPVQIQ